MKDRRPLRLLAGLLPLLGLPAAAQGFEIGLPLKCAPGKDCWIIRYVDHDPGTGFSDHACGRLGTDGHDGTDFGLRDSEAIMDPGTPVTAVAAGTVLAVRDGMPDQPPSGRLTVDFGDRNCGNGLLLEHPDGWQTQYCHLHPGSLAAKPGDRVQEGQTLGLVGMSGEANFAHVHLTVRHDERPVDPFTGTSMDTPCDVAGSPLWHPSLRPALAYIAVPIVTVGLTDHVPSHEEIVAGTADDSPLAADRPLVGYVMAYGLQPGDRVDVTVTAPNEQEIAHLVFPADQPSPRATRSGGRKPPAGGWRAGTYRVDAKVTRGEQSWSRSRDMMLNPPAVPATP